MRILLIEDDEICAGLVALHMRAVRWADVSLTTEVTLRGGLRRLEREHFDLVITDLGLPDSQGMETVSAVLGRYDQPVIVLTTNEDPRIAEQAFGLGVFDFMTKASVSTATLERPVRLALLQARTFASLKDSEARFRSLVSLSSDWYWEQDEELRFTRFDGRRGAQIVLPPQASFGLRRWELPGVVPISSSWAEHIATLQARQPFRNFEYRRIDAAGGTHYISISGEPVFDGAGRFRGYRGTARNITAQRTAEEKLRRFRLSLDKSGDMIVLIDRSTMRYIDVNETLCRLLGYTREEMLAKGPQDVLHASRAELEAAYDALIADPETPQQVSGEFRCKDGSLLPFESTRHALRSDEGWVIAGISRDIRERLAAERQARASELRFRQTFELAGSGMAHVAPGGRFLSVNRKLCEILGYRREELERLHAKEVSHPEDRDLVDAVRARLASGELPSARLEKRYLRKDGAVVWVELTLAVATDADGGPPYDIAVFDDITERKMAEQRIAFLAQFDPLTHLPNRALLVDRLSQGLAQAQRRGGALGVLFVDLDEFKPINDMLGHNAGDEVLKEIGRRLEQAVRPGDTVARISGDEFCVVLGDLAKAEDAALVAQKINERLAGPIVLQGHHEVFVSASIGIASYPGDGEDAESLIGAADAAMYRAKQAGRNTYHFFTSEITQRTRARAQLGAELRRALERQEFTLYYQPKFDLRTGSACGAEALLRWQHPERGLVMPAQFVPVLEDTGLIVAVGEWALHQACRDLKARERAGLPVVPVAVNLSARQFRQRDLDRRVRAIMAAAGVNAAHLQLEITESQVLQDADHAVRVMLALREAGVSLALDDFGTGYSSLSYLTRLPLAALKIDRSFVAGIGKGERSATIVRTVIDMARTLGFTVIAEGVETDEQLAFLRRHACDQAQGFLFARAMPGAHFDRVLAECVGGCYGQCDAIVRASSAADDGKTPYAAAAFPTAV